MHKRGISTLIATVLIIGITISAFGIVYTFVMPLIKESIEANRLCGDVKVMINTQKGYTCYNSSNGQVNLQVLRGPDNINISSLQFKISGQGNSNTVNLIDGIKPVGLWHMDEGPGATTIIDSSGNGHTGKINGSYWIDGKLGSALNFDGADSYIDTSFIPLYNRSFTVGAWVKTGDIASDQMIITQGPGGQSQGLHLMIRNSRFYFGFYYDDLGANALLSNEIWYYVVFRYDSSTNEQAIYINGVIDNSRVAINDYQGIIGNTGIGRATFGFDYFNGTIDEVAIWNKSLSPSDISNLYNSGNGQKSNLIEPNYLAGYWPLDEGSGISTADSSGKGNTGVLANFKSSVEYTSAGKFGGAYEFDGEKGYVKIRNDTSLNLTNEITIGAWVKAKSFNGWSNIFGSTYYDAIRLNGNIIYNVIHNGTVNFVIGSTLSTDKWYHIVLTYNGSIAKTYLNGALDGDKSFGGEIMSQAVAINRGIGADLRVQDLPANSFFNGTIDEVSIYDRALNSEEIKKLYGGYNLIDKVISPNGERTYVISSSSLNNVDSASVAPIVKVGNKEHVCSMMPDVVLEAC